MFSGNKEEPGLAQLEAAFALWKAEAPLRQFGIPASGEYLKACEDFLFARTGARVGGNVTFDAWVQPRHITVEKFEILFKNSHEDSDLRDVGVCIEGPTVYFKSATSGPSFDEHKMNVGFWYELQRYYGPEGRVQR
jgi:hypothetical protein